MLLEFENIAEKEKFLNEGREIWQPWFKTISAWEEVVIPEECNTSSPNLAFGRVGILTSHPGIISSSIKILVDGKPFQINILEDIFESRKLSPVLAANDFYQKMSWWDEDSIGENGSFNSDAPALHEVGLMSPEASPAKDQQSHDREYEKSQANIPGSGTNASPRLHNTLELPREEFTSSDAGSDTAGVLSPLGQNRMRASPSPVIKIHRPTRSLDLNRAPSRSFPSVSNDQFRFHSLRPLSPSRSRPHTPSSPSRIPPSFSHPIGDAHQLQGTSTRSLQVPHQSTSQAITAESNATSWEVAKTITVGESVGFQETKSSEVKNKLDSQIWGSPNFQCEVIDPVGLSGGIASIWDPSFFQVSESIKGVGFLAIKGIWLRLRKNCCLVNVYAPQDPLRKRTLWNNLFDLINSDLDSCWTHPDSTWALVIKAIHGPDGGLSRPLAAKRRSGCWGSIACLPLSLEKDQVPFLNHLRQVQNVDGSRKWTWSLESSGVYTVSSMRSLIDNMVLPHSGKIWKWNPLVPGKGEHPSLASLSWETSMYAEPFQSWH
ncbi:unnamed protein product [Lactuca saligna]|uniref:Uncharacterized protein n=1 Tax=Lactuca saligna TaxID=75948 RepID=A0AA35YM70_LACSI|nr:unnamed protein product [Lactuca saligna]